MKKFLLGILAVLLIAILASPAVVGWVLEDQLTAQIEAANQRPELNIEKLTYRRGWLRSHAEYQITLERPEGNTVTVAAVDVHHGPLPVSALWTDGVTFTPSILILKGDATLQQLAVEGIESPNALPPLKLLGTVHFNRQIDFQCSHPGGELSFTRPATASAVMNWQAGSCSGELSAKNGNAAGAISTGGIDFKDGATDLQAAEVSVNFKAEPENSVGQLVSRVSSLNGRIKYGDVVDSISANSVMVDSEISAVGEVANALFRATVSAFSLRDFELSEGAADITVNGIPKSALGGGSKVATANSTPPARAVLAGAELLLNQLSGQLRQGALNVSGRADLRALDSGAPLELEPVLKALRGSANIVADEPLVGYALSNYAAPRIGNLWYASSNAERAALRQDIQNSQQLKLRELLKTGWLKAEGDRYRSDIDYADGQLTVNGNAIRDPGGI